MTGPVNISQYQVINASKEGLMKMVNNSERRFDPTMTMGLRRAFAAEAKRRIKVITKAITAAIVQQDVFGLIEAPVDFYQASLPGYREFQFLTNPEKVAEFMRFVQELIDKELLEVSTIQQIGTSSQQIWLNRYITDSYKRGVQRARYELKKAGYPIPTLEQTGGIAASMATPVHIERMGMMYIRAFEELRGISNAMSTQISRILAQGIADGDGPRLLARKLVATINGVGRAELGLDISYINPRTGRRVSYFMPAEQRAITMTRTEVIRAHHQGMIQEYKNWAVEGVKVRAEWRTVGDERVCQTCLSYEGMIFSLKEILNLIPAHANCRCIALPVPYEQVA